MIRFFKKIKIFLNYQKVGADSYGNKYYQSKKYDSNLGLYRRIVKYRGVAEPSKIPQVWHAWLYHILKDTPSEKDLASYSWQKEHEPNLTGTEEAYFPTGHVFSSVSKSISSSYKSWKPRV